LFTVVSAIFHERFRYETAVLIVIPVIIGSWYLGIQGGISMTVLSVLTRTALRVSADESFQELVTDPVILFGSLVLILISLVVGRLGTLTRERREELLKWEEKERTRETHTTFLELLNKITVRALEADNMETTLNILVEEIGKLFEADDCFFSYWDEARGVPVPTAAYGSMRDIFPFMSFEPGDLTLSMSVMKSGHPIAVTDMGTPHISNPRSPWCSQAVPCWGFRSSYRSAEWARSCWGTTTVVLLTGTI
jgi:hypothetical protein